MTTIQTPEKNRQFHTEYFDEVFSNTPILMQKEVTPFHVAASISNCMACPLNEYQKPLQLNNVNASLMIIGEDPRNVLPEYESGRLLHDLLDELHFDRHDIYFTSMVKCIGSTDMQKCHHHLISEILAVEPLVIIALGYYVAAPFMEHLAKQDINSSGLAPGSGYTLENGSDMLVVNRLEDAIKTEQLSQQMKMHFQLAYHRLSFRKNNE